MESFEGGFLKLTETQANAALNSATTINVPNRLSRLFSQYKFPDHPTYSSMIERAIKELNEEEGSTEDSISQFILDQYIDLSLAHWTFLKHHLLKRCKYGDIAITSNNGYMLVRPNSSLNKNDKQQQHNVDDDLAVIDWANDLIQESEIAIQDHVMMDMDELKNLPNEDLFRFITNIDILNPFRSNLNTAIEVHKDEKLADSLLQQEHHHYQQYSRDEKSEQLNNIDKVVTPQGTKRGRGRPCIHEKKEQTIKRPRGRPRKRSPTQDNHDHGLVIN